jgi:hypothetical protein
MRVASSRLLGVLGILAAFAAGAPTCRASDKRAVDKIFESWLATQGGIGPLPQVSSYGIQESLTVRSPAETKIDIRLLRTRAAHFRMEFTPRSSDTLVFGFDGDIMWQARHNFGYSLVKTMNNDPMIWETSLFIGLELVPATTAHYPRDPEKVDGVDCIVAGVDLIGAPEETCYFERKTMKLVRVVRPPAPGVKGSRRSIVDIGDYRPIGKLSIPHFIKVDDGRSVYTYLRTDVTINPPVDEGSFVLSTAQVQEANTVSEILARQMATLGGREAFAGVHTRVTHMAVQSPTTGMHCTQTVSLKAPNLVVVETQTPGIGWETRGYDGKTGWFSSEIEGNRPLKPAELSQLLYLTNINQLGQLASTCPFRRLLGPRLVNGRPADAVALSRAQGPAGTFYFDKESGRLVRIATSTGITGDEYGSTIDFSDFRVVDGVEVPFLLTAETPVMKTISKVESVQNNVALNDSLFHQPKDE